MTKKSGIGNQLPPLSKQIDSAYEKYISAYLIKLWRCTDKEAVEIICKAIQLFGTEVFDHKLVSRWIYEWQNRVFNETENENKKILVENIMEEI